MRHCPHCAELIQDAAAVCRFCKDSVPQLTPTSQEWTTFARTFYKLPPHKQWQAWEDLEEEERGFAQRVLGIDPPDHISRYVEAEAAAAVTSADSVGSQFRRIIFRVLVLVSLTLALLACALVLRLIEGGPVTQRIEVPAVSNSGHAGL